MDLHRAQASRAPKLIAAISAAVFCLGVAPMSAAAQPSPSPTPSTATTSPITAEEAQRAKNQADKRVAQLQTRINAAAKRLAQLTARASRADNDYNGQLLVQAQAEAAVVAAENAVSAARANEAKAGDVLERIAVANYMSGGGIDSIASSAAADLLVADDPSSLLAAATVREMAGQYQASVMQAMADAVAATRRAEAEHRRALTEVATQTDKLKAIRQRALDAVRQARVELSKIQADIRAAKMTQAQADAQLSLFLGGWSAADPSRANAMNRSYMRLAAKVKDRPLAANTGTWTKDVGLSVMYRAIQWIGTPYAWAGGNGRGPTRGVCVAGDASNDCHVVGFDCSGLVLYAWAPYLSMAHFAATQYAEAGRVHPAPNKLLPGDLVFWSYDGTAGGIHHVAMYVGKGNVIQAPQSGDIVRITPLGSVSSGYFGATRPFS